MSMRRLLGSAINLSACEILVDNTRRTKRPPRRTNIAAVPASCHVLIFRCASWNTLRCCVLLRWWRAPCLRVRRPLHPTAADLRTRTTVALRTRPAVDPRTRPVEALRPATTGLGTASPGSADVARLPAVAADVLQGAMADVVIVSAPSPVEVAAVLRAQPGVMLSESRL